MRPKRAFTDAVLAVAGGRSFSRAMDLLERLDRRSAPHVTVLMYHRIDDPQRFPTLDPSLISATPPEFERQVAHLAKRGRVLSLHDLLAVRRGERDLEPGSVMVTFDDAYRDFAEHAWPSLRRHGVPVTLFVPTAFPDDPGRLFWWDRLHHALHATPRRDPIDTPAGRLPLADEEARARAFRTLRAWIKAAPHTSAMDVVEWVTGALRAEERPSMVLGWEELRQLAAEGVALAAHSRTHPLLDRLPLEDAKAEVAGSLADLEREIGPTPSVFAFPGGGHSDELERWMGQAGFEIAFGTSRGSNGARSARWLRLNRVNVGLRSSLPVVRAQLLLAPRARALALSAP